MKTRLTVILFSILSLYFINTGSAQNSILPDYDYFDLETEFKHMSEPVLIHSSTLPSDVINALNYYEGKIISLAEATPEESLPWRPAEGVRSIGEVFVHISLANYFFFTFFGHQMPEGYSMELEKTKTDKEEIVAEFKPSFEYAKAKLSELKDDALTKTYNFFGNQLSGSALLLIYLNHAHEHLGQSIAYARMNGITPPWSSGE